MQYFHNILEPRTLYAMGRACNFFFFLPKRAKHICLINDSERFELKK